MKRLVEFKADVNICLSGNFLVNGKEVQGQTIAFLFEALRVKGWQLKDIETFKLLLKEAGYTVAHGREYQEIDGFYHTKGQSNVIVFLE